MKWIPESDGSDNEEIVRPTLHHFGLVTGSLQPMRDWYAKVLGMSPVQESVKPLGERTPPGSMASWVVTNDGANHSLAIICDGDQPDHRICRRHCVELIAFDYPNLDDLLSTYTRLKGLGIQPVAASIQDETVAFYYLDPDNNCIELAADNSGDCEQWEELLRNSPELAVHPTDTFGFDRVTRTSRWDLN
jgi:catechol-2,3-dioxygenase